MCGDGDKEMWRCVDFYVEMCGCMELEIRRCVDV